MVNYPAAITGRKIKAATVFVNWKRVSFKINVFLPDNY